MNILISLSFPPSLFHSLTPSPSLPSSLSLSFPPPSLSPNSGLDVDKVLAYFNVDSSATKKGASTFAISYLLYKMLLPVRATITIACVPVIVRSLRARGWMKGVAKTPTK